MVNRCHHASRSASHPLPGRLRHAAHPRWSPVRHASAPLVLFLCVLLTLAPARASDVPLRDGQRLAGEVAGERLPLWPDGQVPGQSAPARKARVVERSPDPAHPDRFVDGIDAPYMIVHAPPRPNGQAVLVIPGGGYQRW